MPKNKAQPLVVKAITAAELCDVSRQHIYNLMARGELRRIQIPGSTSVRIPLEDVYALIGLEVPETTGE